MGTTAVMDYSHSAQPKGRTRAQLKAAKDRREAKVKKSVRQQCVDRDGHCRAALHVQTPCIGESQWAHMHEKRRSKTRGQAPEMRHMTAWSLMLCRGHHDAYDGRTRPVLVITALTDYGADSLLRMEMR